MSVLHRYIIRSFIGPFCATFLVMIFFLLMQFLWKYIDDLVGKGVEWYYLIELLFYTSASLVPLALPISVLLSSLMTFGNLGEHNELAALKSSGVGLVRVMRPLIFLMLFICGSAFLFSNYVMPVANLKGETLLRNISTKKPALNIRAGVFYGGIEGFSIKIGEKYGPDRKLLREVYIYDHTSVEGKRKVIAAKRGAMDLTPDERFLLIDLEEGTSYEEVIPGNRKDRIRHPFIRSSFDRARLRFDLSSFQSGDLRQVRQKSFQMLNIDQLTVASDSLGVILTERKESVDRSFRSKYGFESTVDLEGDRIEEEGVVIAHLSPAMKHRALEHALRLAKTQRAYLDQLSEEFHWRNKVIARYRVEWHKKFSLSFAVLVLFFIGAPLGAIIRKGGIGLPVVVSVCIFIVYHTMSFSMEKMGRELVWTPAQSMWTASFILLPIGIFLTYKAATDSALLNMEAYLKPLENLKEWLARRGKKSD